ADTQPCGSVATPSPSPAATPSPSPSPTSWCDDQSPKKINDMNCNCVPVGDGIYDWDCECPDGYQPANYKGDYASIGGCDPNNSHNDGHDCCICNEQNHTCPSGCNWSNAYCECVDFIGSPCAAASPFTDIQPGGDGNGDKGCVDYYWVEYICVGGWCTPTGWRQWAGCFTF